MSPTLQYRKSIRTSDIPNELSHFMTKFRQNWCIFLKSYPIVKAIIENIGVSEQCFKTKLLSYDNVFSLGMIAEKQKQTKNHSTLVC